MADKRTTPEAAEGAPRRKRAAPTIDLIASEVPSPSATQDPPPAHEQRAQDQQTQEPLQPDQDHMSERKASDPAAASAARDSDARRTAPQSRASSGARWPALAGGIIGAVLVALLMFALWLTGLVPIRYAGQTALRARVTVLEMELKELRNRPAADTSTIEALTQRIGKIEESIAKFPVGEAGLSERVTAADNALKSLGIALTALNRRSDDVAANVGEARARADAALKAVTDLQAASKDAREDVAKEAAREMAKELAKGGSPDAAARLSIAASALRDAVARGAPFAAELAAARSLGGDTGALTPLDSFAASGIPDETALAKELTALIPAMRDLSANADASHGGFFERLKANAGNLVRIRPVDAPPGDEPVAVLARVEADTARADIAAALAELAKLPDATRKPAAEWIAKAQARQAALAAARTFAAGAARALGKP